MTISSNYVVVKKAKQPEKTGDFGAVEATDDFIYRGTIVAISDQPTHVSNAKAEVGDEILFAKYSPDTFEFDGKEIDSSLSEKVKFIKTTDILAIIKNTNAVQASN